MNWNPSSTESKEAEKRATRSRLCVRGSRPPLLSECECIQLMERHGIGTDASISQHIENVCKRKYCSVERDSRRLRPTDLGVALYRGLARVDASLVHPEVRCAIEQSCALVASGAATREDVVEHAILNFQAKYAHFVRHVARVELLFEVLYAEKDDDLNAAPLCLCGRTRKYLSLRSTPRPARLFNARARGVSGDEAS